MRVLSSSGSGSGNVAGSCKHGNGDSGSTDCKLEKDSRRLHVPAIVNNAYKHNTKTVSVFIQISNDHRHMFYCIRHKQHLNKGTHFMQPQAAAVHCTVEELRQQKTEYFLIRDFRLQ